MSKTIVGIIIAVVLVIAIAAILLSQPPPQTQAPAATQPATTAQATTPARLKEVKIGCLFDLTGATADVGVPWADGVRGAIEAYNEHLLKNVGVKLVCVERDYGYKIPEAQAAYEYFKQQGVVAIIGWGTGDTLALAPSINKDGIPYFSGSYTVTLTVNPYNFFTMPTYQDAAIAAVRFVKEYFEKRGLTPKLALTYPNVPYGLEPLPAIRAEAKRIGVTICDEEIVELTASSAREQVTRIKEKCGSDVAIWWGGTTAAGVVILKDMVAVGLDNAIFITNIWGANERTPKALGADLVGKLGGRVFRVTGAVMYDEMKKLAAQGDSDATLFMKYVKSTEEPAIRGWHSVYVLAKAIEYLAKQGKEINGKNIREALESMGEIRTSYAVPVSYKPGDHRPSMEIWVYVMNTDGTWSKVEAITLERVPFDYYGIEIKPVSKT